MAACALWRPGTGRIAGAAAAAAGAARLSESAWVTWWPGMSALTAGAGRRRT
jgi:hypothetical protein